MELDLSAKDIGKQVLDKIAEEEQQEERQELRIKLLKGKWFLKGAEVLVGEKPIYYDRTGAWWVWNEETRCWEERDETDVLIMCKQTLDLLGDTSIRHGPKLLEGLRQVSREKEPNELPLEYIQFGGELRNIKTGEIKSSSPQYFSTNPIPWKVGDSTATPVMDELITSWVGEEHLQTVYEIIAYCAYRDYPIHRIFTFAGSGANGKTRLLKIIEKFIGEGNKASTTLTRLSGNNFALYPLYRRLVCFVGETAHHRLESTEIIKALSGQDPVSFEAKGRNAFTGTNYAKLIIGTNVLPTSSDTSRGWYRRWFVLKFPNEFQEGEDVLNRIPDQEYENLAAKAVQILPGLLKRGTFSTEGTIEDRQTVFTENSNPIKSFIAERYERDPDNSIRYTECYLEYLGFLAGRKLRKISKREFSAALEDEGFETQRTSIRDPELNQTTSFTVIWGLKKRPAQRCMRDMRDMHDLPTDSNFPLKEIETNRGVAHTTHTTHTNPEEPIIEAPLPEVTDSIGSVDILDTLRRLGPMRHEDIASLYPTSDLDTWLQTLKDRHDIMENPSGVYRWLG